MKHQKMEDEMEEMETFPFLSFADQCVTAQNSITLVSKVIRQSSGVLINLDMKRPQRKI